MKQTHGVQSRGPCRSSLLVYSFSWGGGGRGNFAVPMWICIAGLVRYTAYGSFPFKPSSYDCLRF